MTESKLSFAKKKKKIDLTEELQAQVNITDHNSRTWYDHDEIQSIGNGHTFLMERSNIDEKVMSINFASVKWSRAVN